LHYDGAVPTPAVGTLLGAYRVEGLLGSGSMGEVFRCIDVGLNRRVAIKILSEKHRDSPELRARFVREGRAVAAVSHPNVVQVFATGTFDERPYIAMEFLDGTDLGSLVERQGPLDSLTAVRAVFDAASGLEAASRAGLIHRDVKPSNLVRLVDGNVKVTDFGLAKPVDPGAEPALTAMGVVVGTPDYIAPEQARGEAIDERVDIYALGGSLFFMLTGVPPFRTGKPGDDKYLKVVARHLRQPAPAAIERVASVDGELSALAQQMMSKRREERPGYPELLARVGDIAARLDPSAELMGSRGSRSLNAAMVSRPPLSRPPPSRPPIASPPGAAVSQAPGAAPPGMAMAPPPMAAPAPMSLAARPNAMAAPAPDAAGGIGLRSAGANPAPGAPGPVVLDDPGLSLLPPPTFPRWSIAVTVASLALFVAGLVVYLGRSAPAPAPAAVVAADAAAPAPVDAAAAPPSPSAPPGMILVKDKSGKPAFYVDARPVSVEAFRSVFTNHPQKPRVEGAPVLGVSYTAARSYAKTVKARLLTAQEWELASTAPGFVALDGLYEWVESDGAKRTAKKHGEAVARKDQEYNDVSFRLAREL
jgi:serine/threonine protein kinase